MAGVRRNLTANLYATAAVIVGQIVLVPLFLRIWGEVYYGQWLVLFAVPSYLTLSDIGISNALGNEFSMAVERGELVRARSLLGAVWRIQSWFFLALALLAGLAAAALPLQRWLRITAIRPGEFGAVLLLLVAFSLLPMQIGAFAGVYRAAHEFPKYLLMQGHVRVLEVLGTAVLLLAHGTMIGLATLLLGLRVVWLMVLRRQARRLLPSVPLRWHSGTWSDFRSLLPSGAGFFAFPVGNALINQGVTLVANSAGGPGAVVLLSVCRQVGRLFLQASSILFTSLHPELTTAYAKRDRIRTRRLQAGALGLTVASGIPFVAGAAMLGGWIVRMWTGSVDAPNLVVAVFSAEAVTAAVGNSAMLVPWAANRLGSLPLSYFALQAAGLISGWLLFSWLGVAALGAGFIAGNLLFGVAALGRSLRELDCSLSELLRSGWNGCMVFAGFRPARS